MDQCSFQPIFTEEATEDAIKFIYSKMNYVGVNGLAVKELANVSYHGIYGLTRARYLKKA